MRSSAGSGSGGMRRNERDRTLTVATMSSAFLAAVILTSCAVGCAIERVPEGIVSGVPLSSDLSLILREGVREGEVIARFGAPTQHTRVGNVTTMVYTEVFQQPHHRLELFGSPVGPDARTRTQLHLVFVDDSLIQAWVEVSRNGQESESKWLLGAPKVEGGDSPPPVQQRRDPARVSERPGTSLEERGATGNQQTRRVH